MEDIGSVAALILSVLKDGEWRTPRRIIIKAQSLSSSPGISMTLLEPVKNRLEELIRLGWGERNKQVGGQRGSNAPFEFHITRTALKKSVNAAITAPPFSRPEQRQYR